MGEQRDWKITRTEVAELSCVKTYIRDRKSRKRVIERRVTDVTASLRNVLSPFIRTFV